MTRQPEIACEQVLIAENKDLRLRLHEAEQALAAICSGSVDALVLDSPENPQVFTLTGAETPYRSFVEQMHEGAVSLALDGTIMYCNQRFGELSGRPLECLVGTLFKDLTTSPSYFDNLLRLARREPTRGELSLFIEGSRDIPVSASIRRLQDGGADLCMVVTDLTDIVNSRLLVGELEVRVAERTAELLARNLELQSFTYSVSHDMRTPLRAMVGNAHMVVEDESERLSEMGKLQLQSLSKAALKMAQLVDDLLQFARLGGGALVLERTNLHDLAMKVAGEVSNVHPDAALHVSSRRDVWAVCDPRFIGMALQNLFDNACKYRKIGMPARVEFGSEPRANESVFFVRDEGIGFDMRYLHKLFLPFERLHRDSEYVGTGIGLANVKRAIERHGGTVWAEAETGIGSKFSFTLPQLSTLSN